MSQAGIMWSLDIDEREHEIITPLKNNAAFYDPKLGAEYIYYEKDNMQARDTLPIVSYWLPGVLFSSGEVVYE